VVFKFIILFFFISILKTVLRVILGCSISLLAISMCINSNFGLSSNLVIDSPPLIFVLSSGTIETAKTLVSQYSTPVSSSPVEVLVVICYPEGLKIINLSSSSFSVASTSFFKYIILKNNFL